VAESTGTAQADALAQTAAAEGKVAGGAYCSGGSGCG